MFDLEERNDHVVFYPKALGRRIHPRNILKQDPAFYL